MESREVFLACLTNLHEARLYFEQGLTDEAIEFLEGSLRDLDSVVNPEKKHNNLRKQIESYLETLKDLRDAAPGQTEGDKFPNGGKVDPDQLYKHALALFNSRLYDEAVRELQQLTALGYHVMECLEMCGDAAAAQEEWEDALGYYETVDADPNTPKDDKERIQGKIARYRQALARRTEAADHAPEDFIAGETPQAPPSPPGVPEATGTTVPKVDSTESIPPPPVEEVRCTVPDEPPRGTVDPIRLLNELYRSVHAAKSFDEILPHLEKPMLELLNAERLTVYKREHHGREIVSRYKTGTEIKAIRLPISPSSIAGYVALTQRPLKIDDAYERSYLASIHPQLKFDSSFDESSGFRTRSMLVVPIKKGETILGVLQVINRTDNQRFGDKDLKNAQELAQLIGQKLHYDLQATQAPFDYLLRMGKLTPERLEEAKRKAAAEKTSVAQLLIRDAGLSAEEVGESLEHYYQVPFVRYDPDLQLPADLLRTLNRTYLKAKLWVPIAGSRDKAIILIDDPNDSGRIMEIQQVVNARSYEFRVGLPEDIMSFLGETVRTPADSAGEPKLEDLVGQLTDDGIVQEADIGESTSRISENEAAVVQLVNRLILDATKLNASDIHVEPGKGREPAVIRMRVDGVCREALRVPASHIRAVVARIKILARLDIAERRKPQDGKITVKLYGKPVELRVATLPTVNGESAVLRVLVAGSALPLDKLDLARNNETEIVRLTSQPHGMFLVVGPTGSGKTTTLHAILGRINTPERKIWTAEDPVEITQRGLQQLQVEPKIGLDFASALRSFLRADPDVILIGEMRDRETAHIAIESSLTGHLVFSTLHTNSAPETITRLLDLGLDPLNFADALLGILAQRLVRTLCANCKAVYSPSDEEVDQLSRLYGPGLLADAGVSRTEIQLCGPVGCEKCAGTGYRGRTGIHELLVATLGMKHLIAKKGDVSEMRAMAVQDGMRTLMQDGILKVLRGRTDLAQLRRVTVEQ